jgi:hypothetical protein
MRSLILLLCAVVCFFDSKAQEEYEHCVMLDYQYRGDKVISPFYDKLEELLEKKDKLHVISWNEKLRKSNWIFLRKMPKKPIGIVKFTSFSWRDNLEDIDAEFIVDTAGKTKEAYFRIKTEVTLLTKQVDVKTHQIIDLVKKSYKSEAKTGFRQDKLDPDVVHIARYNEEFGGDPAKLKKDDYNKYKKKLAEVRLKYMPELKNRISKLLLEHVNNVANEIERFQPQAIVPPFKVIKDPNSADEKKIKSLNFGISTSEDVKEGEYVQLYQIVSYNDSKSLKYKSNFRVDEVGEKVAKADLSALGGKKALAELIKENAELVMFKNKRSAVTFSNELIGNGEIYVVGVKKKCVFCEIDLESSLLVVPMVKVVERNAPEMKIFENLAKLEFLINEGGEELLNQQLGIRYLFYKDGGRLMATDIQSGQVIGSERPPGWLAANYNLVAKDLLMNTFNRPIRFVSNDEISKGKLKSFVAQSDFGFFFGEGIGIYELVDEKVGNKVVQRKQIIGDAWFDEAISDNIAKFKVKNGEREVLTAQGQGKKLLFEYFMK